MFKVLNSPISDLLRHLSVLDPYLTFTGTQTMARGTLLPVIPQDAEFCVFKLDLIFPQTYSLLLGSLSMVAGGN